MITDVVILCGGSGTRLKEVTGDAPKVLAEVTDRPFLHFLIDTIAKQGFKRFVLCAGYKAELVKEYFEENCTDLDIEISRETEPLGTAGALKNGFGLIQSEECIVLNGDSFCRIDYQELISEHKQSACELTIVASHMSSTCDYGRIELDSRNRICFFKEKQNNEAGYVNAGIYCFNKEVINKIPDTLPLSLEMDVFPALIKDGINAYITKQFFYDIGTPGRFREVQKVLKDEK